MSRNAIGETTNARADMSLVRRTGKIRFRGPSWRVSPPPALYCIGVVPEGRRIVPNLSVTKNLTVVAANRRQLQSLWIMARVLELFPGLVQRAASMAAVLSGGGGEQKALAMGCALMTNTRQLILDVPTEGLALLTRKQIWHASAARKATGQPIIVVDKHLDHLARLADHHIVLELGLGR